MTLRLKGESQVAKTIRILGTTVLRGPNMWTYQPAIEALVDIGDLEDYPSNKIPGLYERLSAWMPSLIEHRCSYDERGGFLRRLREGTWPAHIMEHVAIELQCLAGGPGGFGRARETSQRSLYKLIVGTWHEDITRAAIHLARDLVMAAIEDQPYDVAAAVATLRDLADDHALGPSTACIVTAADDRRIAFLRLNDGNLVQLGHGAEQRRIWTAETDLTSAIAEGISRDKDLTKSLLRSCGVPVPEGRLVSSAADAWVAAEELGAPVVVKPYDGNHGRGVFVDLSTREEVEAAYAVALNEGSGVIVERFIAGDEHRLLVVGGRVVAASRGEVAAVTGDGRSTVAALIDSQINSDPRRGNTEQHTLNRIGIDSGVRIELGRQGLTAESVPADGRRVVVQRMGNLSNDVTDLVHPAVAAAVALAARVVRLDIAGIDLVTTDISRPLAETGGALVEVNAGPGLLMHIRPANGEPRPVGRAIVDHLFPGAADGRIPVVGITGSRPNPMLARLVAHLLQLAGHRTGLASSEGLFLDRREVRAGDRTDWASGAQVLMNKLVEAAVFEHGPRRLATEGTAYDRCLVGIVTDIDAQETFPELWLDDADLMFRVMRTQVDVVLAHGAAVLNAHDAIAADMARLCEGAVILYGTDAALPVLASHRAAGGRAVVLRDGRIVLAAAEGETVLFQRNHGAAPAAMGGALPYACVLPAVAAAWALGLPADLIETALATFDVARPVAAGAALAAAA
jgi:cyanophycin synthetase